MGLLRVTVLAAWLLALAAPAAAKLPHGFVGVSSEDVFAAPIDYQTSNLSAQAAIGISLMRQTFDWGKIERRPASMTSRPTTTPWRARRRTA